MQYFVSFLVLQSSEEEERAGCFTLFAFLVSCDCCVALPHKATSVFDVYDFGIS